VEQGHFHPADIKTLGFSLIGHAVKIIAHNIALAIFGYVTAQTLSHRFVQLKICLGKFHRRLAGGFVTICHDQYNLQNESRDNDSCYLWKFAAATHLSYLLVKL
jgi:hypothetical protein